VRRDILIVALFVLVLRVPFLNQAIQGDDVYYLYKAEHALIEPLHPLHTQYAFLGQMVDVRGHPHPPFNAWFLALLLAIFKDVSEVRFHAAYVLFSLIAAIGALWIARRFSPRPLVATLLFLVTPAFVVNGNSLEADIPFLAFWLLSTALFVSAVDHRSLKLLAAASAAMVLAALAAYQAVFLVPILLLYGRKWRTSWIAACTPPIVLIGWQLFERFTGGTLPASVLAGYMQSGQLEAFLPKIKNAVALTGHLAWIVFPSFWLPPIIAMPAAAAAALYDPHPIFWGSIAVGVGILVWCAKHWRDFLAQWVLIFFAGALIVLFAGSARYLLPIALPIAILATRRAEPVWLYAGLGCELALSLGLAVVNYQHWDGYRQFAGALQHDVETKRTWINGEWGLRYYLEAKGGLPLLQSTVPHPGDIVVTSAIGLPQKFTTGGGIAVITSERSITSRVPLRIVALQSKSAYSTTMFGLRPFDISLATIDEVRAETIIERKPTLSDLPMSAPESDQQIVSGIYQIEENAWRWMSQTGTILLKSPPKAMPLVIHLVIPTQSPARQVTVDVNGKRVASETYADQGTHVITTTPFRPESDTATVVVSTDKILPSQLDRRQLSIILTRVGFEKP
jgi:hypothetical protein